MCNGTPFTVGKISPRAGLEPGTARSVGQHLTHSATGAPFALQKILMNKAPLLWETEQEDKRGAIEVVFPYRKSDTVEAHPFALTIKLILSKLMESW